MLNFLKTFLKDRRIIGKRRTCVQDARTGTTRAKGVRNLREEHKGFQGQLGHRYFTGRICRLEAIRRYVIDEILFPPITCRGVVVKVDLIAVLPKGALKFNSYTGDLRKLGM